MKRLQRLLDVGKIKQVLQIVLMSLFLVQSHNYKSGIIKSLIISIKSLKIVRLPGHIVIPFAAEQLSNYCLKPSISGPDCREAHC